MKRFGIAFQGSSCKLALMRLLRILFLVLAVAVTAAPQQSLKERAPNEQGAQKQVSKPTTDQPVPDTRNQNTEAVVKQPRPVEGQASAKAHDERERAQRIKEQTDILLAVFTGLLVVVGFLQWLILRQHERWMKKNVEIITKISCIARQNAEAAVSNAKTTETSTNALKNIHRAWVLTGWTMGTTADKFELWFRNYGPTPAQVIAAHVESKIIRKEELSSLRLPPDYGDNRVLAPQMIPPQDANITLESIDIRQKANMPDQWSAVWSGDKITVVYGFITYLDVLDPSVEHETKFCYWHSYKRNGFHVGGPSEYNKAN